VPEGSDRGRGSLRYQFRQAAAEIPQLRIVIAEQDAAIPKALRRRA
jgi:hypothetical protein